MGFCAWAGGGGEKLSWEGKGLRGVNGGEGEGRGGMEGEG